LKTPSDQIQMDYVQACHNVMT